METKIRTPTLHLLSTGIPKLLPKYQQKANIKLKYGYWRPKSEFRFDDFAQNLYNVKVPASVILFNFSTRKEEKMEKYLLSDEQLQKLMEKTIDLFLEYQYKRGYEEPLARSRAVMDVIGQLRHIKGPPPFRSE